jgi:hypothetical protein
MGSGPEAMRIYKYWLYPLADEVSVRMPYGAKILHVYEQNEQVALWALVDPSEARFQKREFRIAGTGHEIADVENKHYIGTVHMNGGALVFHVFEEETL